MIMNTDVSKPRPRPWKLTDSGGQGLVIHGNVDIGNDDKEG